MINKNNLVKCYWCKNLMEGNRVNDFLLYDKRTDSMVERNLCLNCQYLFDSRDSSHIMKLNQLKARLDRQYGK